MAITTTTSSMIVELNQMRVRMERMERELDALRRPSPSQTQSQSQSRPRFKNNARFLPEILSQIVTNITSAILYVFGILYGSELSKSVHKLEIILILLIIFVTLIFIAHGIKQISTPSSSDSDEKDHQSSSRPSKQRTPYSIGESASSENVHNGSSASSPSTSTFATPFAQWKLFWQFASEIVAFLSQYVVFIFVGAIKDVLVDTSISGPWAEFILLRPLSFVAFLIFIKILIQYLHEGVKN